MTGQFTNSYEHESRVKAILPFRKLLIQWNNQYPYQAKVVKTSAEVTIMVDAKELRVS
jgi:hypothetical protein